VSGELWWTGLHGRVRLVICVSVHCSLSGEDDNEKHKLIRRQKIAAVRAARFRSLRIERKWLVALKRVVRLDSEVGHVSCPGGCLRITY
jgi:hypothetical protein